MDSDLWKDLPKHVLETVLLFLPFASAMQFKSVWKEWRQFLASNSYYTRRSAVEQGNPWLLLCTSGMFSCAFDFSLKRWHKILNPPFHRQSIISASGNFVCLGNLVADCRALSICDPVRKLVKNLPPMNKIQLIHKVSLILVKDAGTYKILVVGEKDRAVNNFGGLLTELYDSKTQIWRMSGETMAEAKFGVDAGVWVNNLFYSIVEMPYGVVTFDEKRDVWEELEAEMPGSCNYDVSSPCLVECRGVLLMVIMRKGRESGQSNRKVEIWELLKKKGELKIEEGLHKWVLLEEMEVGLMASCEYKIRQRLICCGVGEWVCIITQLSPRALVFNMVSKKWEWLTKDPAFPQGRASHLYAFPLDPISHCQL